MSSKIIKNTNFIMKKKESIMGDKVASIPEPIYHYLGTQPEFEWFFFDGGAEEFVKLNPQFKPENRIKYTMLELLKIPLVNRGKWQFDSKHGARKLC